MFVGYFYVNNGLQKKDFIQSYQNLEYKPLYNAILSNDMIKVDTLLKNNSEFFSKNQDTLFDQKFEKALIKHKLDINTLKYIISYGFDIHRINIINIIDSYNTIQAISITKNLKAYITPKDMGYIIAHLLKKNNPSISLDEIKELVKDSITIDDKPDLSISYESNSFMILKALFESGKADNKVWLEYFVDLGVDIKSEDFFARDISYYISHNYTDKFIKKHLAGIQNMLDKGLIIYPSQLEKCSCSRIKILHPLQFGKQNSAVDKIVDEVCIQDAGILSQNIEKTIKNPIFVGIFLMIIAFIVMIVILDKIFNKTKE